ncbi:MAG: hypothetical protein EWM47_08850 [Anaerolineaceae bacterium]|nr:MAG: hypothetical protein EWM47_08850 [Anaerolineaceae bacterium]
MEVEILENMSRFIEKLQHIFSLRRTKITLYIVAVLWIAVVTQIVMNRVFFQNFEIAEAFVKTNTEDLECSLEIVAQHHSEFLSETDKKAILQHIANAIELNIDSDIDINRVGEKTEYSYHKRAKKAETSLKIVSIQEDNDLAIKMKHYIVVRLNIKESIKSIEKYRKLIEGSLDELGIANRQVNVLYEGIVDGFMSKKEKEDMASLLVKELQGEVAFDYQQGESYTVYAYTGLIKEYIETVGCKINIQIAMTYDEQSENTRIYLATPIINQSW